MRWKEMKKIAFTDPKDRQVGLLATIEEESELRANWAKEDIEKLYLLGKQYNLNVIDPRFFQMLALELARKLYPEPKRRGRKNKWTPLIRAVLVVEVERRIEKGEAKRPLKTICHELSQRDPWESFIEEKEDDLTDPDPGAVIERVYQDSKKLPIAKAHKGAFLWHGADASVSEWNDFVKDTVKKAQLE
jgi:hypothetical protein